MILAFALLLPLLSAILVAPLRNARRSAVRTVSIVMQTLISGLLLSVALSPEKALVLFRFSSAPLIALRSDETARLFLALVAVGGILTVICSAVSEKRSRFGVRFYAFLFLSEAAASGAALSSELLPLFVCVELLPLFTFPLAVDEKKHESIRPARKYLLYSLVSTSLSLFGAAVLALHADSLSFTQGGAALHASPLVSWAILCVALGFGAKAGLYPLHGWLPSLYATASAPVSVFLLLLPTSVSFLALVRLLYFIASPALLQGGWVQTVLLSLALLTLLLGSILSYGEKQLKKRLAYTTLAQTASALVGLFLLSDAGIRGALLQSILHTVAKLVLLSVVFSIISIAGSRDTAALYGIGRRLPVSTVAFSLSALSFFAFPPTGGFLAQWALLTAALDGLTAPMSYLVPIVLLLSSLLTAASLLLIPIRAFFPAGKAVPEAIAETEKKESLALAVPLLLLALLTVFGGILLQTPLGAGLDALVSSLA